MKKIIAIFLTVIIICLCFVGCNKSEDPETSGPSNIAVGIQNTVNCSTVGMDSGLKTKLQNALLENGTSIDLYEIDGDPYRINEEEIKSEYKSGLSKSNRQTQCSNIINRINKIISDAVPVTPEVDILSGITTLTNAVNSMSYGNSNEKQIFVISNLLSTKGVINFAEGSGSIYVDLNDYAEFAEKEMPNLEGIKITWFVADTADLQQKLPNSDKESLKSFYQTIINSAGGTVEFVEQTSSENVDKSTWPAVSTVEIRNSTYSGGIIDVTLEESVLFKSDSTEWIDAQSAENTLSSLVDAINDSDDKVVVAGSTATTSSSELQHVEFSLERANKVKEMLVSLGAKEDKLVAIGIGKSFERYRVPDTGEYAIEENLAKNRCVYIISAATEKASYFISVAKAFDVNNLQGLE